MYGMYVCVCMYIYVLSVSSYVGYEVVAWELRPLLCLDNAYYKVERHRRRRSDIGRHLQRLQPDHIT